MGNEFAVCCGVDVGKWAHHVVAIDTETGEVLFDSKVDQSEREIRAALSPLCAAGKVRVVVDEPGPMSRLLFAVAKDMGMEIGFLTPRAMAKAIEMYGGDIKTDRRDATILAEVASGIPKLVKAVDEKTPIGFTPFSWPCARPSRSSWPARRYRAVSRCCCLSATAAPAD